DNVSDSAIWRANITSAGTYEITASVATEREKSDLEVECGGQKRSLAFRGTGAWDAFTVLKLGTVRFEKTGEISVIARPREQSTWQPINLRWIKLKKVG
ncbi:MAG TPA: hypothetical protein VK171_07990, partial [Fimbriimonas sp.]|nr:hypothetical protein [Fimbriimonas sp.]